MAAGMVHCSKHSFFLKTHIFSQHLIQEITFCSLCVFKLLDGVGTEYWRFLWPHLSSSIGYVCILPVYLHSA